METDPRVMDLSIACVTSVKNATGMELDLTQDTLPVLDHYATMIESSREEVIGLLAPMCGAYFGELVRRHLGLGQWDGLDGAYEDWRLELAPTSLSFNPLGVALEVMLQAEASGWAAHLDVAPSDRKKVDEALAVYGAVREEDFFRFTVRFEGVEQAVQTLLNNPGGMGPHP
ncbi:MAG: hypothetical protein AAGF92_18180 [Myxococcota bacterium]